MRKLVLAAALVIWASPAPAEMVTKENYSYAQCKAFIKRMVKKGIRSKEVIADHESSYAVKLRIHDGTAVIVCDKPNKKMIVNVRQHY